MKLMNFFDENDELTNENDELFDENDELFDGNDELFWWKWWTLDENDVNKWTNEHE